MLSKKNKDENEITTVTEEIPDALEEHMKKNRKKGKRRKVLGLLFLLLLIAIAGFAWYFLVYRKGMEETAAGEQADKKAQSGIEIRETTSLVTATGTTSIGIVEETFTPDYISTNLIIEEIYLSSGDEVEEGTAILKITEDSLEEARKELTSAATTADLAYRAGLITYEQSMITAKYDYDLSVLEKQQAQEIYDETVASLQADIDEAQEAYDEAVEELQEYQDAIANDTYAEEYDPEGKEALYWEDRALLVSWVDSYSLDWGQVTGSSSGGGGGTDQTALKKAQTLYKLLSTEEKEYQQAQDDYEEAVSNAQAQIKVISAKLPSLEAAITEAKNAYTEGVISAKATYDSTLASASMADSTYDTAVEKAEEELDSLLTDKEDAEENLAEFEELLGDGTLYTSGSGTILMLRIREGETLSADTMVFAYSNPEEITVSAAVDQADIASLTVGDAAMVSIDDYGTFTGTITTINPETSSSSRTSVTYTVTIALEGDVSSLSGNLTASVIFGMEMGGKQEQ